MTIGTTDLCVSKTTSYQLREATIENGKKTKHHSSNSSRKVLSPTKTASIRREEGHDCSQLETQNTVVKVSARFFFSIDRFWMASGWECQTIREGTCCNGAQSHCGQHCQAAHAALSPTLSDNTLKKITDIFQNTGYQNLSEIDQGYLNKRFALTKQDQVQLSSENKEHRLKHIQYIVSRLTPQELRGSFTIDTSRGAGRNATFDNPTASNRIDCHLERYLRPLEDELAEACRNGTKTPKEALQELHLKYQELLKDLAQRLSIDHFNLISLAGCWSCLIKCQQELPDLSTSKDEKFQEMFKSYLQVVESYLKAFDLRFDNAHGGVPQLKEVKGYLNSNQSYYVLRTLLKKHEKTHDLSEAILFFEQHLPKLQIPADLETPFQKAHAEIERRKLETTAQRSVVDQDFEKIHQLMKMSFGEKDSTGVFHTPTKKQLAERLNQSLASLTPTRSDRQRKKASRRLETEDPLSPSTNPVRKKLFVGDKNIGPSSADSNPESSTSDNR